MDSGLDRMGAARRIECLHMQPTNNKSGAVARALLRSLVVLTILLLGTGVAVRGLEPALPLPAEEDPNAAPSLREPLQFLQAGAHLRIGELDSLVPSEGLESWRFARKVVFAVQGCPTLASWLQTSDGLVIEREIGELRRGNSEEALASLALIFQLARASSWEAEFMGGAADAEKLGELLSEWLRGRAESSVSDPVLREAGLAAVMMYGRSLRVAYQAPILGRNDSAFDRARSFLGEITGIPNGPRTAFGRELQARFGRAVSKLSDDDDLLVGLEEEAKVLFPGLNGACE